MSIDEKFTTETITHLHTWTPNLFTLRTTRFKGYKFVPGQFARLGLRKGDKIVWRAYSILSANYDDFLEFYSIVVPEGEFTSELANLHVGDEILIDKIAYGALTTDRFVNGKDLWMLSTGTGLAPFISVLYDFNVWEQYDNIILVHCAREKDELAYEELIHSFHDNEYYQEYSHKLKYVQTVTRETVPNTLNARITELLENGELEKHVGIPLDIERSRIMICGNPDMVDDTRHLLTQKGLTLSKRSAPGNFAVEQLW